MTTDIPNPEPTEPQRFLHESDFLAWFNRFHPDFNSSNGVRVLEERADVIMFQINQYFHPAYMQRSENARYLAPWIEDIRDAYMHEDYARMASAIESFKFGLETL